MTPLLSITDLHACLSAEPHTPILHGINLTINPGEVHAIMGPNGSGKSTLAKLIAGHPSFDVTQGAITYHGESILEWEADERARKGLFLAFQYPTEVPGVSNEAFLRLAYNAKRSELGLEPLDEATFATYLATKLPLVEMRDEYLTRHVNTGFSGGEKKRNEILQMAVLEPTLAVLDETDSGLDIDALRIVANGVNQLRHPERAIVMVTHYQRLLDYIVPDHVHVLAAGRILRSGDKALALELEERGYDWLLAECGVTINTAASPSPANV
jgi:Fe-S cluster assembly ATP-binding protein